MKKSLELKLFRDISDVISSTFKFILAKMIISIFSKERKTYLIGSNYGNKRSDNAKVLFNYIKSQGKNAYFIENKPMDKASLKRGSLKSFIYYFQAKGTFYSHSFSDILPGMHKVGFFS